MKVKTRFAPSPTGFLHVGGVRTALFAWLVSRQASGQFILRIEDTDRSRHVKESEKHIMDSLSWLGIKWDEGPYRQSERLNIYKQWAQKLIAAGRAYSDERTSEQLEEIRTQAAKEKRPVLFREHRPANPPTWKDGVPLRFLSKPKDYKWHDEVMGDLSAGKEAIDDFIIIKSDGYPTYNFAHIIDDYQMECTHVIRSQEFLSSVPKYLNLYEALEIEPPLLATLPYVLSEGGNKKLSKRDGAKDILDYARNGYLPEAIINFMASLGWNDGTEQEIFSVGELVKKFSLKRVQKGGAKFDVQRLDWTNGHYIRQLKIDDLYKYSADFWPAQANGYDDKHKKAVLGLVQERLKYLAELPKLTSFFFEDLPINKQLVKSNKQLAKLTPEELKSLLKRSEEELKKSDYTTEVLISRLNQLLKETGQKPAVLFSLIRIATTQSPASPPLAESLAVLGRETVLRRIDTQLDS